MRRATTLSPLERVAKEVFGSFSAAERKLLRRAQGLDEPSSTAAQSPPGEAEPSAQAGAAAEHDSSRSIRRKRQPTRDQALQNLGAEHTVDARLLRWLCVDRGAREYLEGSQIRLEHSRIAGRLNLAYLKIPFPIVCVQCWFPEGIDLLQASLVDLTLDGSWLGPLAPAAAPGEQEMAVLMAEGLRASGSVSLRDGLHAHGGVNFLGADIGGDLTCSAGTLVNPDGIALTLERAKVHQNVHLRRDFVATGEVRLMAAEIGGDLDCTSGTFTNRKGYALVASGATIGGNALLRKRNDRPFRADGGAAISESEIRPFHAEGGVAIDGAEIRGQLVCTRGKFIKRDGWALNAEGANIHHHVFLGVSIGRLRAGWSLKKDGWGFEAEGGVRLFGARIGGNLICHMGRFHRAGDVSLDLERAKIAGSFVPRCGFDAAGEVRLFGTEIGGDLECPDANFTNPGGVALNLTRARVGTVKLSSGFRVQGDVQILSSDIGGDLDICGADFGEQNGSSFHACGTQIKGSLNFTHVRTSAATTVDLTDTACAVLKDDVESWPAEGHLVLDGFSYRRLADPGSVEARLRWLRKQLPADKAARRGQFRPQPYRQLAGVLRAQGLDGNARAVLIGMAVDRRKWGGLRWWSRLWQWLLWATIGNGHQPIRAFASLLVLWAVGFVAFGAGYEAGVVVPTETGAYRTFMDTGAAPASYEPFCALTYAIDTSLLIISFGQRDKWHLAATDKFPVAGPPEMHGPVYRALCQATFARGWFARPPTRESAALASVLNGFRWVYLAVGWFLTTMFVAGISGLVGRD